ncbi:MAG: hypothetical protein JW834_04985 [Candidatus Diapherotrites archaeon]|nr:hypothetical protein [Candidatus Diapherotrites archaeon]
MFSLDAVVGLLVVTLFLIGSASIVLNTEIDDWQDIQLSKQGADIMAVLHYGGVLESLDNETISQELNALLQTHQGMRVEVIEYENDGGIWEQSSMLIVGEELPDETKVIKGQRHFLSGDKWCTTDYWIWLK